MNPGVKMADRVKGEARRMVDNWHSKYADGAMLVVEPFIIQLTAGTLSDAMRMDGA